MLIVPDLVVAELRVPVSAFPRVHWEGMPQCLPTVLPVWTLLGRDRDRESWSRGMKVPEWGRRQSLTG